MQLNLLTRLGQRVVMTRADPPSTVPGAWRDSAISQLEALARANERSAARARRRRTLWTAGITGLALLWGVSFWRQASDPPRVPAPLLAQLPATVAAAAMPAPAEAPPAELPADLVVRGPSDAAAVAAPAIVTAAVAVVAVAEDEAERQARAQRLARRKAALQAQERARAEQESQLRQQLALAAQLEAERTSQHQLAAAAAREQAAEQARRQALQLAQHRPRGVTELCAGSGGWASEQQCHARQCWKAEHQADAVCARLREVEFARVQRGADH